jgi:hypothetical protein
MRRIQSLTLALFTALVGLTSLSANVMAEWVEVTGFAPLENATYAEAREAAREDALQQALVASGVRLTSHQYMENGELKRDELSMDSEASIRRQQIREEYVEDDVLHVKLAVDIERLSMCPNSSAAKYKKTVALMGFSLQVPDQANIGRLQGIEEGLSSALNQSLSSKETLVVYQQSNTASFARVSNAPSHLNAQQSLSHAMAYAKQLGAQFVVSGVVRDLGLANPKAYANSAWRKTIKFFAQANTKRRFSVDVFVHDGLSGEIVWNANFATEGDWPLDLEESIGFATQAFWRTPYGHSISELLDEMAYSLDEQLRCQPFMTRVSRVDGKTLHFSAGASSGIRPGDQFSVYRSFSFYDANMLAGMELTNTKTALTVSQVHPNFSSGTIKVDPGRINIQEDDLLIAW